MRVLLLLSALLMSFNLSAERILLDQEWRLSDVPGEAIYYLEQAPTEQNGEWPVQLFYLETDKPVFKGSVNNPNLVESFIVGDFEFFYPNGQLSRKGSSDAQGHYQGTHLHYWEDGALSGEYHYQNGQLHGDQKSYYTNGQLRELQHRVNGAELGLSQSYHANGQLASRANYGANGMEGRYESFYDNGKPEQSVNMVAGKYQGERLFWAKEGWLYTKEVYLNGKMHGEVLSYQVADILQEIKHYQHGKQVGLQQRFKGPGLLAMQQEYDNAGREIQNITYDNAGNVATQTDTQYLAKGRISTEQRFDATGKLTHQYQRDTAKNWSLRQRFDSAGELIERDEQLKGQYEGLYIGAGWNGYVRQINYSKGQMHGAYREDNAEDGSFVKGQYHLGLKVGQWITQNTDTTRNEQFNQQGQLNGEQSEISADGTIMHRAFYKNAKLHGAYLQRGFDKQLQAQGQYVNGQREGQWLLQDESSYSMVKLWHGNYKAGHEVGSWQAFSANGHLLGLTQYDDKGQLQGKGYSFNEDGSLLQSDEYLDNQLHGRSVYYFNGEPSSEYLYQNGLIISE
ncbi:toxin-antitoxin system YwqK family antitoxin [Shewanella vaxholmensis]|uniref:toxin-antitoxin system YwqK family antitoxin n=1 Tax=Shewanella vaxholmensis TaxID=3063535 RepID=UPI003190FD63